MKSDGNVVRCDKHDSLLHDVCENIVHARVVPCKESVLTNYKIKVLRAGISGISGYIRVLIYTVIYGILKNIPCSGEQGWSKACFFLWCLRFQLPHGAWRCLCFLLVHGAAGREHECKTILVPRKP